MSDSWTPSPELQSLAAASLGDELTDDEVGLLESSLGDVRACRWYRDMCLLEAELRFLVRADNVNKTICDRVRREGELYSTASFLHSVSGVPSVESASSPPGFLNTAYHGTANFFSQDVPFACLMSTLIVGFALVIASLVTKEHYTQMPGRSVASAERSYEDANAADKANAAAKEEEKVPWVGRITGMVDCKWSADEGFYPPSSYDVVLGRKYKLDSGLMEITYNTGAKVILQGPVTYEVESTNGGYMSLGKLTGKVETEEAKGFSVRTPTAVVIDLGTEFGVEVNNGCTESRVFRGVVEVRIAASSDKSGGKAVRLGANEFARVSLDSAGKNLVINTVLASDKQSADGSALDRKPAAVFVQEMPKRVPMKLFNTGTGLELGQADPHWQLVARSDDPKFKPRPAVATTTAGEWMDNDPPRSQWISVVGDASNVPDGVVYTFRTTFQLTDAYLGTAFFRGMFAVDNHVRAIRLNGREIPVPAHGYDEYAYTGFHAFSHSGGFVEGANVLELDVENGTGNAEQIYPASSLGLRVELEGSVVPRCGVKASSDNQSTANNN